MQVALVIGHTHSTIKHRSMEQKKLLLVQPLMADSKRADGVPLIAVDMLGAGVGQKVMLTSDGAAVKEMFQVENSPIRWATLGLIDD